MIQIKVGLHCFRVDDIMRELMPICYNKANVVISGGLKSTFKLFEASQGFEHVIKDFILFHKSLQFCP
jgi:hypothetical protein